MATTDAWLATTQEDILEPDLPICDPHHHLWDEGIEEGVLFRTEQVEPRYLLDDLLKDTNSGHNIKSTVYIEAGSMYRAHGPDGMRPVGETEFVAGVAAMSESGQYGPTRVAAGIVGFADLLLGDAVAPVLEAHITAAGGRFRGIRHTAAWCASDAVRNSHTNPTDGMMASDAFRAGFAKLAPLGLSFEGWCFHTQISEMADLARAFPDTTIILNHFGGPIGIGPYAGKQAEIVPEWKRSIDALAKCPNVHAKLGGIHMKVNGFNWNERETAPSSEELVAATRHYYDHCIERFGPDRCLFESNFPVEKLSCSYHVLWNTFKRIASGCSADEKAAMFHDTAARVYRITPL